MASALDAERDLERALERVSRVAPYADAAAQTNRGSRVRLDKHETNPDTLPWMSGAVFRAWTGSGWAETVAAGLEPAALGDAAEALVRALRAAGPSRRDPPGPSPEGHAERRTESRRPVRDWSVERRIEWAGGMFGAATAVTGVDNAIVNLFEEEDERLFRASTGARRYQRIARIRGTAVPLALENGKVEYDFAQAGGVGGTEILDALDERAVQDSARRAVELLHAKTPPMGRMPVVLDPSTTGTFAHESFGHGTEADQILRDRSYLKPLLGQTLGPESLTLVDDGSYPDGWGTLYFDDEGCATQRTAIIERGRFVEVLHDRETAAALGRRPTGNARRADYLSRTFVRMTNTIIEPRDWSLDELVREAKAGVLLETCTSGIEDPLGGQMQIKVKRGRVIEGGRLTDAVTSMTLSGRVLETLRAIRGVGRKEDFAVDPGYCGKGHTDMLPVASGGPYLLTEAVIGPG